MNSFQRLFGKQTGGSTTASEAGPSSTTHKPKGSIRYVLLVVSHPVQPDPRQTFGFLNKIVPELQTQQDGTAKIGTLWETKPIATIDMSAKAVEAFGHGVVNNDIYTYRTLHLSIRGGDAKCLVVYDKDADSR
jgi:hypothetical protein